MAEVASEQDGSSHAQRTASHLWIVIGPSGCGKTTIAQRLATQMNIKYLEGDDFHPQSNVDKMAGGTPLTDADRWDWLIRLRRECLSILAIEDARGVVLTCSALKCKYRDVLRVAAYYRPNVRVHFVYLHASEEVLTQRVASRKGHYMSANMVHSQVADLELPDPEETDVISVDVARNVEVVWQDLQQVLSDCIAA